MQKVISTMCQMCGVSVCGINVYTKNGKIVKVEGNPDHPFNGGALCSKAFAIKQFVYSPNRLKHPLRRVGEKGEGKWEKISWDDALSLIANKLKEIKEKYGAEAVDFHMGHLNTGGNYREFFRRLVNLFGSPNIGNIGHICFVPRCWAWTFMCGAMPRPDFAHTDCMVLWGVNPAFSMTVTTPKQILDAKERGAKLIVIDPRSPPFVNIADKYVRLRPGTDGALALAMLNVIINENLYDEEFVNKWTVGFSDLKELVKGYPPSEVEKITWVESDTIREISRMYATAKSACLMMGNSLDHHTNSVQTARAIADLAMVTGNLGVPGGNILIPTIITLPPVGGGPFALWDKLSPETIARTLGLDKHPFMRRKPPDFLPEQWIPCHTPSVFDAVMTGKPYPIKAIFVIGGNLISSTANTTMVIEALKKLEFLVDIDIIMNPTAKFADIVLPACTFLEYDFYKHVPPNILMLRPRVIEPIGESWPDLKIVLELAKRMGYEEYFPWKTIEEAIDAELKPTGVTFKQLLKSRAVYLHDNQLYLETKFCTPSGKGEFYSEQLRKHGYEPLPVYKEPAESPISTPEIAKEYPLILITGSQLPMYTHGMYRNIPLLRDMMPENLLEMHPEKSAELGIKDGDMVLVESLRGTVTIKVKLTEGIDPRVVHMHHGFMEANANVLVDNKHRGPIIGSVGMCSSLCRVRRCEGD